MEFLEYHFLESGVGTHNRQRTEQNIVPLHVAIHPYTIYTEKSLLKHYLLWTVHLHFLLF